MALVAEKDLVLGVEYFLDSSKKRKGIFTKTENGSVYFKKTDGDNFYGVNTEGEVSFWVENYIYETI